MSFQVGSATLKLSLQGGLAMLQLSVQGEIAWLQVSFQDIRIQEQSKKGTVNAAQSYGGADQRLQCVQTDG